MGRHQPILGDAGFDVKRRFIDATRMRSLRQDREDHETGHDGGLFDPGTSSPRAAVSSSERHADSGARKKGRNLVGPTLQQRRAGVTVQSDISGPTPAWLPGSPRHDTSSRCRSSAGSTARSAAQATIRTGEVQDPLALRAEIGRSLRIPRPHWCPFLILLPSATHQVAPDSFRCGYQRRYQCCPEVMQHDQNEITCCAICRHFCMCSPSSNVHLTNTWAGPKVADRAPTLFENVPELLTACSASLARRRKCQGIKRVFDTLSAPPCAPCNPGRAALPHP